jgi:hypothetical protein
VDLNELSMRRFGNGRSLEVFLVYEETKLSELPDLLERIETVQEVFTNRRY